MISKFTILTVFKKKEIFLNKLLKEWPEEALELVARKFLDDVEINENIRSQTVQMCKVFHQYVISLSTRLN